MAHPNDAHPVVDIGPPSSILYIGSQLMLRDIHAYAGSVGTFCIAIGMVLVFLGWWMAITATVVREGVSRWTRMIRIILISLVPPLGILFLAAYIRSDGVRVSRSMAAVSANGKSRQAVGRQHGREATRHRSMSRPGAGVAPN